MFKNFIKKFLNCVSLFIDKLLAIILWIICLTYLIAILINTLIYFEQKKTINKPFNEEDKKVISKFIDAKGKDIIIILDEFEDKNDYPHGRSVNHHLNRYIKEKLNKEIDVLPILLSISEVEDEKLGHNFFLYQYKEEKGYRKTTKLHYSLENYIGLIRELNPNSKIVLSLSTTVLLLNDKVVTLSKKYNLKVAQAYFNSYAPNQWIWMIHYYLFMNKKDILIVTNSKLNTLSISNKRVSPNDVDLNKNGFREEFLKGNNGVASEGYTRNRFYLNNWPFNSTSFLTPILAYEYYLNKNSNLFDK